MDELKHRALGMIAIAVLGLPFCWFGCNLSLAMAADNAIPPQVQKIDEAIEQGWKDFQLSPSKVEDDGLWSTDLLGFDWSYTDVCRASRVHEVRCEDSSSTARTATALRRPLHRGVCFAVVNHLDKCVDRKKWRVRAEYVDRSRGDGEVLARQFCIEQAV